jgi:phospholipid/cholesterol/gamma-HCH transport system substrate-binding protein
VRGAKLEFMVGAFALLVLAILSFITFKIGDFRLFGRDKGYRVHAYFKDAAGLYENAPVKIAGVDAGVIEKIRLEDGRAKLSLRIFPGVRIYPDASAYIRASGLLGDKYVEIKVGTPQPECCVEDGVIGNTYEIVNVDEVMKNISTVSMNLLEFVSDLNQSGVKNSVIETLDNLGAISSDLRGTVSHNRDKIDTIVSRLESLTVTLDTLARDNAGALGNTIANIEALSASLRADAPDMVRNIDTAARDLKDFLADNRANVASITNSTRGATASLDSIARKIDEGEGTIGKLVNDDALFTSVTLAAEGINKTFSKLDRFRTFLSFRGDYLTEESDMKGSFSLAIVPTPEKYYILGLVSDPVGLGTLTKTTIDGEVVEEEVRVEHKLEFNAQFARRFKDTVLRIGFMESTFGVGLDQYIFDDKFQIEIDLWDFSQYEDDASHPHLRIGADYYVFSNIFLAGGMDNVLSKDRRGGYMGGGFRFEDEDLKYLFGAASSAPGL